MAHVKDMNTEMERNDNVTEQEEEKAERPLGRFTWKRIGAMVVASVIVGLSIAVYVMYNKWRHCREDSSMYSGSDAQGMFLNFFSYSTVLFSSGTSQWRAEHDGDDNEKRRRRRNENASDRYNISILMVYSFI